jgi:hypothetical protein
MTLWDFHNQIPQNLEIFEIWQALNSSKRDPERFEKNVARLVNFLRTYRSLKHTPPSQVGTGTAHAGEASRGITQDEPGSDIIGVSSFDMPEHTRPQVPITQPVGPSNDYIEVQDIGGDVPQMSAQNSNNAHCQYTGILHCLHQ